MPEEGEEAQRCPIRDAQTKEFREEYAAICDGRTLPRKSRLLKLMPRVDDN